MRTGLSHDSWALAFKMHDRMKTPASLLERLRLPDQERAWERFVELYTPLLYYWAKRMGCPESEVPDLVQAVFALLVQKLPEFTYDQNRTFRGWLRTVSHRCWYNLHRRAELPRGPQPPDPDDLAAQEDADPFWEVEYRERLVGRALELMWSEFQPKTWQACWRVVVEEHPPADVARELGMSLGAVYMARSRVLSRLREELEGLY